MSSDEVVNVRDLLIDRVRELRKIVSECRSPRDSYEIQKLIDLNLKIYYRLFKGNL